MTKINMLELAKALLKMCESVKIKINKKDKIKAFEVISNFNSTCLPDEVYIVPRQALYILKDKKIRFKEE